MSEERIGLYPGSFDPITLGHEDIIRRASSIFDRLIVAVLINNAKNPLFSVDERVRMIQCVVGDIPNVEVRSFSGLSVEFAKSVGARVLVRGLRAVSDFEYELQMAQTNNIMCPKIDTIFLTTNIRYAYLSSSIVKEVASYGGKIEDFLPEQIIPLVKEKYSKEKS
ncbi:MAG: pantetheine-phosphate adenylyltransferase [Lachnospiraceae bacterium]|nr:pantetheine-phosphate adenylyltransferase [Lachnospiraceae bacterium]